MLRFPPILPSRLAIAGLVAGLLTCGVGPGASQGFAGSDESQRSVLEYARWAEQALSSLPAGIELLPALEDRLAERVSKERRERDLSALSRDPGLHRAARAHAIDMLQRDYTAHVGPAGRSATERVAILHRRFIGSTGENLAEHIGIPANAVAGQAEAMALQLISGFLDSPEHRKNLLEPDYTDHGIGAAASGDRLIVVHVFGARRAALAQDLPLQVPEGAELPLAFQEGEGLSVPAKYGFARPGQPSAEIVPLDAALTEVAVEPGTYQLRFFLPTEQPDRYEVAGGPAIIVQ